MKRLKKLIARVREIIDVESNWLRAEWSWAAHCHALDAANHRRETDKPVKSAETIFFESVMWALRMRTLDMTVCRLRGHKLEDAGSTFTPDSGTEELECSRCGRLWRHVYYSLLCAVLPAVLS